MHACSCAELPCVLFFCIFGLLYDGIYPFLRAVLSFVSVLQWKKKSSLLSIIKSHKVPTFWGMSLSLSHFLWPRWILLYPFQHSREMPYKKETPGSNSFFFFSINTIYKIYTWNRTTSFCTSCTVLREMAAVSVMCVLL